jgi:2-polyprenyl-3-methyl-5-hydroxy-6-metoxy-1,4-benzoquinol methylase
VSERSTCPLCGGGASSPAFTVGDRNRELSDVPFHYLRCASCATLFLADVPDDLGRYYPDDYYELPTLEELERAAVAERPKLAMIGAAGEGHSLVEVGSAFGIFAYAAKNTGFNVTAIEMDARCCQYLREVVGVEAIHSDEPERSITEVGPADAIVLWHVLEHLEHPSDFLQRASERLKADGTIAIAVPNPQSFQFRVLGRRWPHVDAPRHLSLIPFAALRARMEELGLVVRQVTTSDVAGRYWNAFGWEYALRRHPARQASTRATRVGARMLASALAPIERHGMKGAAYTAVFVKR